MSEDKYKFNMNDLEKLESMYGYQSPIEMIATEMQTKYENDCVSVCQQYGFNVDKDELAKALAYDRNQYDRGYADGRADEYHAIMDILNKCGVTVCMEDKQLLTIAEYVEKRYKEAHNED